MTSLNFRIGTRELRVVVDSPRAAKILRSSLDAHIVDDLDAALTFMLTAPTGFHRNHLLIDRAGTTLSNGRGLKTGLHTLANHLAAVVEPGASVVRVGARALISDHGAVLCLEPLLQFPAPDRKALSALGYRLVDRLTADLDIETGAVTFSPIPWPDLRHLGNHGDEFESVPVSAVMVAGAPGSQPSRAQVTAELASTATSGTSRDVLATVANVVRSAKVLASSPEGVVDALAAVTAAHDW